MTEDDLAALRHRLVALREDIVGRLVARFDGGEMALLGSVGAAIAAVDAMQREPVEGRQCQCAKITCGDALRCLSAARIGGFSGAEETAARGSLVAC